MTPACKGKAKSLAAAAAVEIPARALKELLAAAGCGGLLPRGLSPESKIEVAVAVTDHALEQYRLRMDPDAGDEEIRARLARAAASMRLLRRHWTGGHHWLGDGLVFAGKFERGPGGALEFVVTTVFGKKSRYDWEMQIHKKMMWRHIVACGSKY
jgi:hypothetical protein